jgi:hypothetical protein
LAKGDHVVFIEQNNAGARTGSPTDYLIVPTGLAAGQQGAPLPTTGLGISVIAALPVPKSFLEGFAQHLPLAFRVDGYDGSTPLTVTVAASEPGWSVGALDITDQGDGRAIVKTEIIAPADLAEREIRLHLGLRNGLGWGVVSQTFTPDARADPSSPTRAYAVPVALLGGFDMAGAQLGGRIVALDGGDLGGLDPDGTSRAGALIDGLAIASDEFHFDRTENGTVFTLALGGDSVVPLLTPRAALISGVDWSMATETLTARDAGIVNAVTIRASVTGPLGPWAEVAHWIPQGTGTADQRARFEFAQSIWARYLRFDMSTVTPAEYLRLPEQLRVWEAPSTAETPSILGEWGEFSQAAAYERLNAPDPVGIPASGGGATRATAVALDQDYWAASSVERGLRADWWRIAPSGGAGELRLTLDTELQGGAHPDLFDANGEIVSVRRATEDEAKTRGLAMPFYLSPLAADVTYTLRIEEPLRPIVIAWDTSGSTAPYQPALQRALRDIASHADPDRDLIGFLPFGGALLGNGLMGDPELLIRLLGNEPGAGNSSNAESALAQAAQILADQDGVRGVILITDAASDRDTELWDTLAKVRPRVGALAIPSTGAFARNPDRERDLMESWGRANGGFYQYVSTEADFTEGFARAVDRMRGPIPYRLRIGFGPAAPQPDGSLRVTETRGEEKYRTASQHQPDGPAGHLWLDVATP